MKKVVATSMAARYTEHFVEYINDIFNRVRYTVTYQGELPNVKLSATCDEDAEFMPKISLRVNKFAPNTYEVIPTLEFPTLTVSQNDYYDSIEHWTHQWYKVSSAISQLNKFSYCPDDYEWE